MANHTPLDIKEATSTFSLFPPLLPELRLRILYFALKTPRMVALAAGDHRLSILTRPHPLFHTSYESRKEAMRVHSVCSTSTPHLSSLIINTNTDYLFLADEKIASLFLESNMISQIPDEEALGSKLRHLALPLAIFEFLVNAQPPSLLEELLRTFPNLEEIVLVLGEASGETLKQDVEFVMPRKMNVPRKGPLVTLCEETFHPWRAFAHLIRPKMMEDAVGKWVIEKHAGKGELGVAEVQDSRGAVYIWFEEIGEGRRFE